jgi:hypothetical protein
VHVEVAVCMWRWLCACGGGCVHVEVAAQVSRLVYMRCCSGVELAMMFEILLLQWKEMLLFFLIR